MCNMDVSLVGTVKNDFLHNRIVYLNNEAPLRTDQLFREEKINSITKI